MSDDVRLFYVMMIMHEEDGSTSASSDKIARSLGESLLMVAHTTTRQANVIGMVDDSIKNVVRISYMVIRVDSVPAGTINRMGPLH